MQRVYISDIKSHIGESVNIKGFVHIIRDQGKIKFILVRDRTGIVQTVVLKSALEAFEIAAKLTHESVVSVIGSAKEEKQALGGYEILVESIEILSLADANLPIPVVEEKGGGDTEQNIRWDWRWLDLRSSDKLNVFKVWTELEKGFRSQFEKDGFIQIYSPAFMSTASESGAEVFEVSYFEKKAYLAQSPQFFKQLAMSAGFERVFMVGPVFRAEPSYTTRHMTEFTGWDFEMSYIDSHFDIMSQEEKILISGFKQVKEVLGIALEIPQAPFPKITLEEAKKKLQAEGVTSEKVEDLSPEEERALSALIKEETGCDFVFVTDYPAEVRAFYHMRYSDKPNITKSFDLLYKGVEITTGAQREHRLDILKSQAIEKGMSIEELSDYLNYFKFGCPPHGGAGIGPGRIVMKILDIASVKEVTFLPRDVKRLKP